MTDHAVRLYATAGALVAFFLAWAVIAAHPWSGQSRDPRLVALDRRQQRLERDAALVQRVIDGRRASYRDALARSRSAAAAAASAAPAVRVVTLPPVATTRSS